LKGNAFLAEQDPQALVAYVVDPLSHQEIRQPARLQVKRADD
jgi:hypothetical protein